MSVTVHVEYEHLGGGGYEARTKLADARIEGWGRTRESAREDLIDKVKMHLRPPTAPTPEEVTIEV